MTTTHDMAAQFDALATLAGPVLYLLFLMSAFLFLNILAALSVAAPVAIMTWAVIRSAGWMHGIVFLGIFLLAVMRVHALMQP